MAKKKETTSDSGPFAQIDIGDQVKHAKWGVGTVLFRSGSGNNAKAIVVFPEEGQKKLMLRYAKLKKVGTTSLKSVEKLKQEGPEPSRAKPPKAEAEEIELAAAPVEDEEAEFDDEEEVAGFGEEESRPKRGRGEEEATE